MKYGDNELNEDAMVVNNSADKAVEIMRAVNASSPKVLTELEKNTKCIIAIKASISNLEEHIKLMEARVKPINEL